MYKFWAIFSLLLFPPALMAANISSDAEKLSLNSETIVQKLEMWDSKKGLPLQAEASNFNLSSLKIIALSEVLKNKQNKSEMKIQLHYPQGTSSPKVDALIKHAAEKAFESYRDEAQKFVAEKKNVSGWKSQTFYLTQPYERYLSQIIYEVENPNSTKIALPGQYTVTTYDLLQNRQMFLSEVFRKSNEGLKASGFYANFLNVEMDRLCLEHGYECQPSAFKANDVRGRANIALTPAGIAVFYGPCQLGETCQDRSHYLDVPKEDLVSWGVRDVFWIAR